LDEYNLLIAEHFERAEEMALASEYTSRAAQVAAIRGTIDESIAVASRALALLRHQQCGAHDRSAGGF